MKKYSNLYDSITFNDFLDVYKEVRNNTKNKNKIKKFEDFYSVNIVKAYNIFKSKKYKVGRYNIFLIKEPKYRLIMSTSITDKLINHVISRKILIPILEKSLIDENVATRKEKGTLCGIKLLKKNLNEMNGNIYALKFDISKYFYNIDHDILISLIKKKIKDKDVINILSEIIKSTDSDYINKCIDVVKNKEIEKVSKLNIKKKSKLIEKVKSIPYYKKGKGLCIGSMSNQILAIFYLNELVHFIKEKLRVRYMDDGLLLSNDKNYLRYCLKEIINLLNKYKLKINNKTKIINVSLEGIEFLGFRFYIGNNLYLKFRKSTKKRFKRKVKLGNVNVIKSYHSVFKWGECYSLERRYMYE